MNLFEIASEYRADAAKLEDLDLDETTLSDTLEAISGDLETKCMNTAFVARNLEATAAQIAPAAFANTCSTASRWRSATRSIRPTSASRSRSTRRACRSQTNR
jgi:hypothetical protein